MSKKLPIETNQEPFDLWGETEQSRLLPPRSSLYPSNKMKVTVYFYSTLLILFILLLIGLILWGKQIV